MSAVPFRIVGRPRRRWAWRRLAGGTALCALLGLSGCGSAEGDLEGWVAQQRRDLRPGVAPILPPSRFEPQVYEGREGIDPFHPRKLAYGRDELGASTPLSAVELNRRREPLEAFALEDIAMVGSMIGHNETYALIAVDRLLYRVNVGDHMGRNYGRITRIEESRIQLREIVQDASGNWVEREAALRLREPGQ